MALFLLQKEKGMDMDLDVAILREILQNQKYLHSYAELPKEEIAGMLKTGSGQSQLMCPVGSLDFVSTWLKYYGVANMNPIEVPPVLQKQEYLKRDYSIVKKPQLPKDGRYFVKYVSKLKAFNYIGDIFITGMSDLPDGLYQVSEVVDIRAEYRCFIHLDKIIAINYYNGDCTVFPDIKLIEKMVANYMLDLNRPLAYTMDVAVTADRGTVLLEIHPWVSVGLYGYMFGNELPYCYLDRIAYYLTKNVPIRETEIKYKEEIRL